MEPYLIAIDLDGTLLTDNKTIPEPTRQTICSLKKEGHHIVISTGRPYRASKRYYKELGLDTPIVNFNGAYVHHPLDEHWGVYHTALPLETAQAVIATCEALRLNNIMVEVKDDVYIKNPNPETLEGFGIGNPKIVTGDLRHTLKEDPSCILVEPHVADVDAVIGALEQNYANAVEQRSWGEPSNIIEVIACNINKAEGLKRVAQSLNVPRERIIAFGDEDNDLEMLTYANVGVAMGNAHKDVKAIADEVTLTNENNGIGKYLESFFQLQP